MFARNCRWLGLILALLFSLPSFADAGSEALGQAMQMAVDESRVAGCVLVVMKDGRTVFHQARGLADRTTGRPMRTDSLFRLASVSKPLVSAAALRLVQDGRLQLQDPVHRYLPWFRPQTADGSRPEITVHHLLTHTAGLSYRYSEPANSPYHLLGISDGLDQPGLSLEDNLRRLSQAPLGFRPGEKFNYGLSTDVLGAVLEKASGLSLPEVMDRLILGPLELRDTAFHAVDIERLTTPYGNSPSGLREIVDGTWLPLAGGFLSYCPTRALGATSYPSGGGGLVGSAHDVARFLDTMRQGGGDILAPSTAAQLGADQLLPGQAGHRPGWGFSYGWAVLRDPALAGTPQTAGTWQWGGAYGHSWFVDPDLGLTVVLLTNTAFEGLTGQLPRDIREAVYRWQARPKSPVSTKKHQHRGHAASVSGGHPVGRAPQAAVFANCAA